MSNETGGPWAKILNLGNVWINKIVQVRQDVEVLPPTEPRRLSLGWTVSEIVGIGVANPPPTPESELLRWANRMLDCRLFKAEQGDDGWTLMLPPSKPHSGGDDWMPSWEPDYDRIAYGTVLAGGSKDQLEKTQQAAQAIVDFDTQKRQQPKLWKQLRKTTGL